MHEEERKVTEEHRKAVNDVSIVAEAMGEFVNFDRHPTYAMLQVWVIVLSQAVADLRASEEGE